MGWAGLALLSALFAGATGVLAKVGMEDIPSNLGTLIRTVVVVAFAGAIVAVRREAAGVTVPAKAWAFLVLSGFGTGASWLCYFAALKKGAVSQVAPIDKLSFVIAMILGVVFLQEKVKPLTVVGAALILVGVMLTLPTVQENLGRVFGAR